MPPILNRVALVLALLGCDSKKPEAAGAVAQSPPPAAAIVDARPQLGGNLLTLGEHQVELAVQHDGVVRALLFDARGRRSQDTRSPKLAVTLTGEDGRKHELGLSYDEQRRCYWGRANAGALALSTIPVSLERGGERFTGALAQYALLPPPRFGGRVIAVGGFGVELVATPGHLSAHVLDSFGKAVTRIDLALTVTLGDDGERALGWDAPSMSYRVALDRGLDPGAGPLRLTLSADRRQHHGGAESLSALAR